ncbi:UxaA family hydrolase [Paenibacillus xerothermodurans]|uniref:Altronate dehydratase n=1 Tax=Paenibacillus xerothermodurans TaxID=1977292 RepID=A0A2W1NU06_PAEXE|nr:UxaA family hydrolase [Paenibacillus xerothermodurans]PZE22133.1 altronate dehydratase [Paenibacillus xerothermodurans]
MNRADTTDHNDQKTALVIDPKDNVAVALTDFSKGDECTVITGEHQRLITVIEDIAFGHKLAIKPIEENESVLKYGEEIGKMCVSVAAGAWIHSHNMYCERGMKRD